MSRPKPADVSVIIPAWNAEAYVADAVDSALAQDGVDLEVLVVDDCSRDGTAAVVRAIDDPRVHLYCLPRNGGPSAARNHAIAQARGEWLAILDADDRFLPGRLRRLVELGRRNKAAVVADNLLFDRGDGRPMSPMFAPRGAEARCFSIGAEDYIRGNGLMDARYNYGFLKPMFRREIVAGHGIRYDEDIVLGEDYVFMLELLLCGGACLFDETPGYRYRVHESSLSSQRLDRDRIRRIIEADERLYARRPLPQTLPAARRVRLRKLLDADAYVAMTGRLKAGDLPGFLLAALRRPAALRHFRLPLRDRLQRLRIRLRGSGAEALPGRKAA